MRLKIDGLVLEVTPEIYEPSDDSFLLMKYSKVLKGNVLDIGCGCGIQALVNAKHNPDNFVFGIDINRAAVECSRYNAFTNEIKNASFAVSDIFDNVPEKRFDAMVFNPPYLPTTKQEKISSELNHAFDGGFDGRLIIDRFLFEFERHLSEDGRIFLVHSSLNRPEKTVSILEERGFSVMIRDSVSFFFEKLYVFEARRL